ncbi:FAD binding domain-containing protein [Nocardia sp. NPDC004068]|uniref:FAD binding domain-containing protein n=1 Tax=Nocardia sp. NPDC004068 TaxID=3364303 RepID=UPI00369A816A
MDLDTIRELVVARDRNDLRELTERTAVLAGGTWLFSEPQEGLERLVDITALGWPALVPGDAGLEIAATCTLAEFEAAVRAEWPATAVFPWACRALLASHKIRRTATVGGNACLALPAGAVLAALVAMDATVLIWGAVEREMPVREFVLGPGKTVLRSGEVVRSFHIDVSKLTSHTAFRKIARAPLGRSGSVVIGRLDGDGRCAVTVSAATVRPVVLEFAALPGADEFTTAVAGLDAEVWFDDPHGSPAWRRHVSAVLGCEVLAELREVGR